MPAQLMNVTRIDMTRHIGTHVGAPLHVLIDGSASQRIPTSRLHGSGVVWHGNVVSFGAIGLNMLQEQQHGLRKDDMMMLHTRAGRSGSGADTHPYKPAHGTGPR